MSLKMYTDIANKTDIIKVDRFERILSGIQRGAYNIIGIGSGRIVYDLENGYVAKTAMNYRGMAQNQAEYNISINDHSGIFARVTGVTEDFDLLLMEKAEKIRRISSVWEYFKVESNSELFQTTQLQDIAKKHDLLLIDFARASSWGKINGHPVIIDYGFTRKVKRRYY